MTAVLGSLYDKPNRTVHFTNMACIGTEQTISQCSKSSYSLEDGRAMISSIEVAGVQCLNYNPPTIQPCLSAPDTKSLAAQCNESDLRLVGGLSTSEGRLEFCYQQQWSPFCNLHHIEASVACKQLGYTQYTCETFYYHGRHSIVPLSHICCLSCRGCHYHQWRVRYHSKLQSL